MLLTALVSCGGKNTGGDESTPAESSSNDDNANKIVIFEKDVKTKYQIVYADDLNAELVSGCKGIAYQAGQKFKIELEVTAEYVSWGLPAEEFEIIVGNTTRPETAEAKKLLKGTDNEYVIKLFDNGKIAIVASSNKALTSAINYFVGTFVTGNDSNVLALDKGYSYYLDMGNDLGASWVIDAPQYTKGTLATSAYNIGSNIALVSSQCAGKMQLVSDTTAAEFEEYLNTLEDEGFERITKTENNGNIYVEFKNPKKGKVLYTYYLDVFKEVRIIDDYSSVLESEFEYTYEAKAGETTTYYQYGMMHDPGGAGEGQNSGLLNMYGNNGAFDIIKLADNKLILIDGGAEHQATEEATAALVDFLFDITNTPDDGQVTVAAWFLTHTHGDHYNFVKNLVSMDEYKDKFVFERVMHNVPAQSVMPYSSEWSAFAQNLINNNKGVKFMKLHTGQNVTLGNINFDVIMTHEDATNPETGRSYIKDQNNSSTVLKFNINGNSVMYFGDWGGNDQNTAANVAEYAEMENRLMEPYKVVETVGDAEKTTYPTLKADIVQIAHHGINSWMTKVYTVICPDYAFFSQADVAESDIYYPCYKLIIEQLRQAKKIAGTEMKDENIFFAGRKTNWLEIAQDGTITHGEKAIEGVFEGFYYYTVTEGTAVKPLYFDSEGKVTTNSTGGTLITDLTGTAELEGVEGYTAVYQKGYWELLDAYRTGKAWNEK